jgi:protein SCO1/2
MIRVLAVVLPIVLLVGILIFWQGRRSSYQPFGTQLLTERAAANFELSGHDGKAHALSEFKGKAVLIFFGFVHCPDVCPTTMQELAKVYKQLSAAEQEAVQVTMISVDPERDTPEVLARYVPAFHPSFLGLTGTPAQIASVAQSYGVFYEKNQIVSASEYNVGHTATVFALNKQGNLRLIYSNGKTAETDRVLKDLRWLLTAG